MATSLTIGAQSYDLTDLLAWQDDQVSLSANQRAALAFCQRWLSGAAEFVVHTSGSTGAPKPIALHRTQMQASARATAKALGLRAGMRALICLPVRTIAGQMMLARALELGLTMTLVEPAADPLASLPPDAAFDFSAVVPLQLQTLLDGPASYRTRLDRMTAILVGGAPISAALEQQVQAIAAPLYHTYGMTESATHIALRRLNGPDASPWFHPLPGVELAVDARNCLRIKAPMTLDHWLQTNDLVALSTPHPPLPTPHSPLPTPQSPVPSPQSPVPSPQSPVPSPQSPAPSPQSSAPAPHSPVPSPQSPLFRWLGRWDNVINTGGVKVQVETVEAAVERVWLALGLAQRRFFVAGLPDERLGQAVTLLIEGDALARVEEEALHVALAERLERFARPRRVVYLARLAETASGKIDRLASLRAAGAPDLPADQIPQQ